jgi:hypothetical protein
MNTYQTWREPEKGWAEAFMNTYKALRLKIVELKFSITLTKLGLSLRMVELKISCFDSGSTVN